MPDNPLLLKHKPTAQHLSAPALDQHSPATTIEKFAVSILSNFARAYDKYSNRYAKDQLPAHFPDQFFVLDENDLEIGIRKNQSLLEKLGDPRDQILIMRTLIPITEALYNDHATGVGHYLRRNYITLKQVYLLQNSKLIAYEVEDLMAQSLHLQTLHPYQSLKPRSLSVLPVARGCQAACAFCFSKASVSSERNGFHHQLETIDTQLAFAKQQGAERAVITGGGEPTLLKREILLDLIRRLHQHFDKTVLISNAYVFSEMQSAERREAFVEMSEAGLSILAMSHHHWDPERNQQIMKLKIEMHGICADLHASTAKIKPRLICVLQKGGVETEADIEAYLHFAAQVQVKQVCFKELYVSTSIESYYHQHEANRWSRSHQISLSVLTTYLEKNGFEICERLPWGAPIYRGKVLGHSIQIAAYTEPSLFWERSQGLVRSWNIMSDGKMLASLEDANSEIHL